MMMQHRCFSASQKSQDWYKLIAPSNHFPSISFLFFYLYIVFALGLNLWYSQMSHTGLYTTDQSCLGTQEKLLNFCGKFKRKGKLIILLLVTKTCVSLICRVHAEQAIEHCDLTGSNYVMFLKFSLT